MYNPPCFFKVLVTMARVGRDSALAHSKPYGECECCASLRQL